MPVCEPKAVEVRTSSILALPCIGPPLPSLLVGSTGLTCPRTAPIAEVCAKVLVRMNCLTEWDRLCKSLSQQVQTLRLVGSQSRRIGQKTANNGKTALQFAPFSAMKSLYYEYEVVMYNRGLLRHRCQTYAAIMRLAFECGARCVSLKSPIRVSDAPKDAPPARDSREERRVCSMATLGNSNNTLPERYQMVAERPESNRSCSVLQLPQYSSYHSQTSLSKVVASLTELPLILLSILPFRLLSFSTLAVSFLCASNTNPTCLHLRFSSVIHRSHSAWTTSVSMRLTTRRATRRS